MKTKDQILRAFNELVTKSDFESITVLQIVKQAGISRATFYRCFKDKYDVMNYNYSSLLDRHMRKGDIRTIEELLFVLLEEGRNYWKPLLPLFQSSGTNSLYTFIRDYSFYTVKNLYEYGNIHALGNRYRKLNEKEYLQLQVFASGAASIYEDWIRGKYHLTSKEASEAIGELLPNSIKCTLFEPYPFSNL